MTAFIVLQAFFTSSIITLVFSQQPIVSVDVIEHGGTFDVTCDASRVTDLDPSVNDIKMLTLLRQTSRDTSFQMLAQYGTNNWWISKKDIPLHRDWKVDFTGINGEFNNRRTMKIFLHVGDAECADDGMYMCQVTHNSAGVVQNVSTTQTVTSKLAVTDMTLVPNEWSRVYSPSKYQVYQKGDNITLTCRFDGEEDFEIQWKQGKVVHAEKDFQKLWQQGIFIVDSSVFNITDYPNDNDITTSGPSFVTSTGPCDQYEHRSVLNLGSLSQDNDQVMYMCVVMENDLSNATEVARANLTVIVSSKKGDGDTGAIISGSIIGCILMIIAVVVVI